MSSEGKHGKIPDDHSFWRWYLVWHHDILAPLLSIRGFSEILLQDLDSSLNEPLKEDIKREFMVKVINNSKSIRRSLDFLGLYMRCREGVFLDGVFWQKVSVEKILDDVVRELQAEDMISKVVLNKADEIPSIYTSVAELRLVFLFLLINNIVPVSREREISIGLNKLESYFVSIEIKTNSAEQSLETLYTEDLIKQPNHLLLSSMIIELLNGKFEAFLQDKVLFYRLLLPIRQASENTQE